MTEIPYLQYLGLQEKPFSMTPDPAFYFESREHKKAFDYLGFFVNQREGFALIYGDVGTGKTLLCRRFFNSLDKQSFNAALVLNPIMDETEFLRELLREFNVLSRGQENLFSANTVTAASPSASKKDLLDSLEQFLLGEYKKGKECILAVDEAQLLSDDMFDFLRVLSNFETNKDKLLHIILFGQKELISKLSEPNMRYLSHRISVVHHLLPLTRHEVGMYITHRLSKAGSNGLVQFSHTAVNTIYRASGGYPRRINILCDRALLQLYARSKTTADNGILNEVLKEESIRTLLKEIKPNRLPVSGGYAVALGVALALLLLFFAFRHQLPF